MEATVEEMCKARTMALADEKLRSALKAWYRSAQRNVKDEDKDNSFNGWVYNQLAYMTTFIGDKDTVEHLVEAIRVNAMGVPLANELARNSCGFGFKAESYSYVENNVVFVSVWLKADDDELMTKEIKSIRDILYKAGYNVEYWVDIEDYNEVTVDATMPFPKYLKQLKDSSNAKKK